MNNGIAELLVIALGLSLDAFAASIVIGLSSRASRGRMIAEAFSAGLYFGGFQALMPVAGFLVGMRFINIISAADHWVAFVLLSVIGARMFLDGVVDERKERRALRRAAERGSDRAAERTFEGEAETVGEKDGVNASGADADGEDANGADVNDEDANGKERESGSFRLRAVWMAALSPKKRVPLAFATSIDALAVGVTFAALNTDIVSAASVTGAVTFVLSAAGVFAGALFGGKIKTKAVMLGGAVLVLIGVKILLEHLMIL